MRRAFVIVALGLAACRPGAPTNARIFIPAEDQGSLRVLTPSQAEVVERKKLERSRGVHEPEVYIPREDAVRGVYVMPVSR